MSVEYYTKIERGNLTGVSVQVLDAVAERCNSMTPNAPTSPILHNRPTPPWHSQLALSRVLRVSAAARSHAGIEAV